MTYITNIRCPHCGREWVYDSSIYGSPYANANFQTQCWKCLVLYNYSIVTLAISGKTVQAPFCHICDMPMSLIKSENKETDNNHEMTFDIYEWGCLKQPHRNQNIFIGIMTAGIKYLGNTI